MDLMSKIRERLYFNSPHWKICSKTLWGWEWFWHPTVHGKNMDSKVPSQYPEYVIVPWRVYPFHKTKRKMMKKAFIRKMALA